MAIPRHQPPAACALVLAAAFILGAPQAAAQETPAPDEPPVEAPFASVVVEAQLEQFELNLGDEGSLRWVGQARLISPHRLLLRTEGAIDSDGEIASGRVEAFYEQPIQPFVALEAGARFDTDALGGRAWAAVGIDARVPYLLSAWAGLYVSDAGRAALALKLAVDRRLSDRLVIQPEVRLNFYAREDAEREISAGLSDARLGLRLRYEFGDRFAPYAGVSYLRRFGATARLVGRDGEESAELAVVVGLRTTF